ncbi:MAG: isoprenylcysteine carboxylmethyltransferase family protein [Candidatus Hydrogenedentes bacterium]|nr:isoprenylcysteine carboxylmethyltransferase family protein [Candidatus Hydrogenedentota bacterium]
MKYLILLYGIVSYLIFFVSFVYAALFVGNVAIGELVSKTIDTGEVGPIGMAILVNVLLLGLFAVQHTIMARPAFKTWWVKITPSCTERSTFVLLSSLILLFIYWQWRPMPEPIWDIEIPIVRGVLWVIFASGWGLVLYSSFLIDHFDLFGLRQVWLNFQGKEYAEKEFKVVSLYKVVRSPLMIGFIIAFWATPTMSQGHLLWAIVTTVYIFLGTIIEERDLVDALGPEYVEYRKNTRKFIPIPK